MVEHRERLLKLAQEKKSHKRLVKPHQPTHMGSVSESGKEGSSGFPGTRDLDKQAFVSGRKRSRPVDGVAGVTGGSTA